MRLGPERIGHRAPLTAVGPAFLATIVYVIAWPGASEAPLSVFVNGEVGLGPALEGPRVAGGALGPRHAPLVGGGRRTGHAGVQGRAAGEQRHGLAWVRRSRASGASLGSANVIPVAQGWSLLSLGLRIGHWRFPPPVHEGVRAVLLDVPGVAAVGRGVVRDDRVLEGGPGGPTHDPAPDPIRVVADDGHVREGEARGSAVGDRAAEADRARSWASSRWPGCP